MTYSTDDKSVLLAVALDTIKHGLEYGCHPRLDVGNFSARLTAQHASFVTLNLDDNLRGCVGTLEATTSLVKSISENAYAAAFHDPRFSALTPVEMNTLGIHVSVLSPLIPVTVTSEQALLHEMVPGECGWVLQENTNRGTFLPSVWSSLSESVGFLQQLKVKAGLSPNYWSSTLKVWRYTTTSFSALASDISRTRINTPSVG